MCDFAEAEVEEILCFTLGLNAFENGIDGIDHANEIEEMSAEYEQQYIDFECGDIQHEVLFDIPHASLFQLLDFVTSSHDSVLPDHIADFIRALVHISFAEGGS